MRFSCTYRESLLENPCLYNYFYIGVYAAAQELDIPWAIIKGVSSYADAGLFEPNPWKTFASLMAASLTAHILSNPFIFRDWPHYLSTGEYWIPAERRLLCPMQILFSMG